MQFVPPSPDLLQKFYDYRQDPVTRQFNPLKPSSLEALAARFANSSSHWTEFHRAESLSWFVEVDGEAVGNVSIHSINRMMLTAEIGYGVFAAARGRGFASAMVSQLCAETFAHTHLRKLLAFVHEENLASRRVLEKLGFVQEGILREHYLINEQPVNEILYGLLRREWKA